ncbi:MAG: MBL fold metallo-hydrolase [Candidatus Omnitrophota bacterium]
MKITIVCNNIICDEMLQTCWGFSSYIEGLEKTILFDTGSNGPILLANFEKLGLDVNDVDVVVLSHGHPDHTGGLKSFLEKNWNCAVCMPHAYLTSFKKLGAKNPKEIIPVNKPMKIYENVWTTGQLGIFRNDQALVIDSEKGLILITACSHAGIVKIVKRAKKIFKKNVYFLIGGFHLEYAWRPRIESVVKDLKKLEVEKVGPSHCTGEHAIDLFRQNWGDNFAKLGCGGIVEIPSKK